jgi:hypothetical protein
MVQNTRSSVSSVFLRGGVFRRSWSSSAGDGVALAAAALVLASAHAAPLITFNKDIAPILWAHCATAIGW